MALPEEEQMEAVFKSSRTKVDPVSGNEVPPGSLPEEVRDDIPAQLSEGEYVVPADVLRYYGMKFFEDLRSEAKIALERMDSDGRIGGEPIGEMEDEDLTPEEMAEIESMMMAVGGLATQQSMKSPQPEQYKQQQMMYNQGTPVAVGNAGYSNGGEVRGYAPGGVTLGNPALAGTQASFDWSNFGAGFSFSPNAQQNLANLTEPAQAVFEPVTMYSPTGEEVIANTLEEYTKYLTDGYTLSPPAISQPSDGGGDSGSEPEAEPKDPTSWAEGLDFTDGKQVQAMVDEMLGVSKSDKTIANVGLMGSALVGLNRATGVARSRALAAMIKDIDPELSKKINEQVNKTVSDSKFLSLLPNETIDGDQILKQLQSKYGATPTEITYRSMSSEERRALTSAATAATQGGVYKPSGIDVALGRPQGDDSGDAFDAAVEASRARAEGNKAAMAKAYQSGASTDDIKGLMEAFEAAGGTRATGGR